MPKATLTTHNLYGKTYEEIQAMRRPNQQPPRVEPGAVRPKTGGRFASEKQVSFMRNLMDAVHATDEQLARMEQRLEIGMTVADASAAIDRLIALRDSQKRSTPTPVTVAAADLPDVPKGRYAVDGEKQLAFYRVWRSDTGRTVIHVLSGPEERRLPFSGAQYRTILTQITDAGVKESQARYGQEIGACGRCGLQLTDEESRRIGLGPICRNA